MPRSRPNHHSRRTTAVALTLSGLALSAVGLALAGGSALHGAGPAQSFGLVIGLLAFGVIGTIAISYRKWRGSYTSFDPHTKANRLYIATNAILLVGAVLVPLALIMAGRGAQNQYPGATPPATGTPTPQPPTSAPAQPTAVPAGTTKAIDFDFTPLLIVLGVVVAVVVGVLIWRLLRLIDMRAAAMPITAVEPPPDEAEEEQRILADAMSAGRRALDGEDARAAIIACYAAMEESLAEAGIARGRADSPAELLGRALAGGLLRGPGPEALAALFREARFSTHPMGAEQLVAAREAMEDSTSQLRAVIAAQAAQAARHAESNRAAV